MRTLPIRPAHDPKRIALRTVTKGGAAAVELEELHDQRPS
jgi:hypothetical protein